MFLQKTFLFCVCAGFIQAQTTTTGQKTEHTEHTNHSSHKKPESVSSVQEKNEMSKVFIPDVEVVTQDGRQVRFYSDLVKGKKVLISFVFTSCELTCPMVGRNFQKLQELLGEKAGRDVSLVTVSTDPVVDTPQVLKKWGEKFKRRDGWTLVTGNEAKIGELLQTLTGSTKQDEGRHTSLLILYDGTSGKWETTSSLMEPLVLLDKLNNLEKNAPK